MTSSLARMSLTGAARGHVQLIDFALAVGYCTFHIHCLPVT